MSRLATRCSGLVHVTIRCSSLAAHAKPQFLCRTYATHKDHASSSLLSQQFDQLQERKSSRGSVDNVGPFQLGIVQPSTQKVKKWSELSTAGKVMRTTARSTNFSVILLGAGLSAVLVYALATELFAKNSPTVLYGDACEKIKGSPVITHYLRTPITFHNNPPLTHRPRHRNRHVNSLLAVDSSGREHLLLNFYVQGSDTAAQHETLDSESFVEKASSWTTEAISNISALTFDGVITWSKFTATQALHTAKRAFTYLVGEPLSTLPETSPLAQKPDRVASVKEDPPWSLSGIYSRLTGRRRLASSSSHEADKIGMWTSGEVHADFVKDANGVFVYRYLLVDFPDSNTRNPFRVYIERTDEVHDTEGIIRWASK